MKTFAATSVIRAPAHVIWSILMDSPRWTEWDPSLDRIEGKIAAGEKVKVFSKLSPGRAFPVRVARLDPDRGMTWRGGMPLPFLFKGERTFDLVPTADGAVEFRLKEVYTGLMSPMIERSLPDMQPAFEGFVAGLKQRAEAAASQN